MKILEGKTLATQIKEDVKQQVARLQGQPFLVCIMVKGDSASEIYVANKHKACQACGIKSLVVTLDSDITEDQLIGVIQKYNEDKTVSGILLQLPLPAGIDESKIINCIDPYKDVDCLTFCNLGKLVSKKQVIAPCTASGIIKMLEFNNVEMTGKRAVVIGRSLLVGKSVANLLEQHNATVTICHSKTVNLDKICKQADILVVAIGKPKFITQQYIKRGATVIDVGINRINGKICGDVDYDNVKDICNITPVPGGVGLLTVATLMENTLLLYKDKGGK